jgi:hypothetical protein
LRNLQSKYDAGADKIEALDASLASLSESIMPYADYYLLPSLQPINHALYLLLPNHNLPIEIHSRARAGAVVEDVKGQHEWQEEDYSRGSLFYSSSDILRAR